MRKIAVVVPKYGLVGGGERFVQELTERIAARGRHEIHVFANRWQATAGSPIIFHHVPLLPFPRFLRPLSFAWFAQRLMDRGNFDLIHSHDRTFRANIYSLHCVPHAGWVCNVRGKRAPSLFDRALIAIESRMIRNNRNACFMPVSSIALAEFQRQYPDLPGTWQIVHPGVDVARFTAPDRSACRAEIRSRHGIAETDLLLLFVGMNFEVKGLDTIIAALAKARTAQPTTNIRLLVVGRGNEAKYQAQARSLGIEEAVSFAGTQTTGLERYYRAADLFMLLSAYDTFAMVVLEAMAAGLPVIVSPNVGAKDLVVAGSNGFVIPQPDDAAAAADCIRQLLDPRRREQMGAQAALSAAEHDWQRLAERVETLYDHML